MQALANPGDRIVLGPSDDGGYYLIGLKEIASPDSLMRSIGVRKESCSKRIDRVTELKLDLHLLPAWFDVDDRATLQRLCRSLLQTG